MHGSVSDLFILFTWSCLYLHQNHAVLITIILKYILIAGEDIPSLCYSELCYSWHILFFNFTLYTFIVYLHMFVILVFHRNFSISLSGSIKSMSGTLKKNFLAMLCSMWDCRSLTRDGTPCPLHRKCGNLTTGLPEKSQHDDILIKFRRVSSL